MASKGEKPDGRSPLLPLGQPVRRRGDPTGTLGVIAAVIFESSHCALVVWRDESLTFERLDMLIGMAGGSPQRDAEVDLPQDLEPFRESRQARTRRPFAAARVASSVAVIVAITLAWPLWSGPQVEIDFVPEPHRVPAVREALPFRDPLPRVSPDPPTVASSPAPRDTTVAVTKPATRRDETRSGARPTRPVSQASRPAAMTGAGTQKLQASVPTFRRDSLETLKQLVGSVPEVRVGKALIRWVKSHPHRAPLPPTDQESFQAL
jgi:hypothetical protein